jgi:hypothetical protein
MARYTRSRRWQQSKEVEFSIGSFIDQIHGYGARAARKHREISGSRVSAEDVVCRVLRLGCG